MGWDEETSRDVLEIILQKEIQKVVIVNKEQHLDSDIDHKGIWFDKYVTVHTYGANSNIFISKMMKTQSTMLKCR